MSQGGSEMRPWGSKTRPDGAETRPWGPDQAEQKLDPVGRRRSEEYQKHRQQHGLEEWQRGNPTALEVARGRETQWRGS